MGKIWLVLILEISSIKNNVKFKSNCNEITNLASSQEILNVWTRINSFVRETAKCGQETIVVPDIST